MDAEWMYEGRSNPDDWDGQNWSDGFRRRDLRGIAPAQYEKPPLDELAIFQTELRRQHSLEMDDRKRRILDPGYDKFYEFQRRTDEEKASHRKAQRREAHIAKKAGYASVKEMPVEELEAALHAQEDRKGDRQLTAAMIRVMMDMFKLGRTACYDKLNSGRMTADETDEVINRARASIERNEFNKEQERILQRIAARERTPALPQREPGLSEHNRIKAERDIDKAAVRAQLKHDTEKFLQGGGKIQEMGAWYPTVYCPIEGKEVIDQSLMLCGEIRALPFNMWTDNKGGGKPKKLKSKKLKSEQPIQERPVFDRREAFEVEATTFLTRVDARLDDVGAIAEEQDRFEQSIENLLGK